MIRFVSLMLLVVAMVLVTTVDVQAGNLFRFRRSATPHYRYHHYQAPTRSYNTGPGYEYQTHRYEARTTTGYTMLFGI